MKSLFTDLHRWDFVPNKPTRLQKKPWHTERVLRRMAYDIHAQNSKPNCTYNQNKSGKLVLMWVIELDHWIYCPGAPIISLSVENLPLWVLRRNEIINKNHCAVLSEQPRNSKSLIPAVSWRASNIREEKRPFRVLLEHIPTRPRPQLKLHKIKTHMNGTLAEFLMNSKMIVVPIWKND